MEEPPPQSPAILKMQIFILAGQSNMSGRGGVNYDRRNHRYHWNGIVPPECSPSASILRLSPDLRWEEAREPLHAGIDVGKVCGVGPGMPFANAMWRRVGLVPCAAGGSTIRQWARGEKLYERMVARARASVADCDGEIAAVLWYQGESDTSSQHDADVYDRNMEDLVANVRKDLCLPALPIIQVAIASGYKKECIEIVRSAQLRCEVPNVVCVDAKGLELKHDKLHLTTQAQVRLGQMLAQAYLSNFVNGLSPSGSLSSSSFGFKCVGICLFLVGFFILFLLKFSSFG